VDAALLQYMLLLHTRFLLPVSLVLTKLQTSAFQCTGKCSVYYWFWSEVSQIKLPSYLLCKSSFCAL